MTHRSYGNGASHGANAKITNNFWGARLVPRAGWPRALSGIVCLFVSIGLLAYRGVLWVDYATKIAWWKDAAKNSAHSVELMHKQFLEKAQIDACWLSIDPIMLLVIAFAGLWFCVITITDITEATEAFRVARVAEGIALRRDFRRYKKQGMHHDAHITRRELKKIGEPLFVPGEEEFDDETSE